MVGASFADIEKKFDESLGYIKNDIYALCRHNETVNYTVALLAAFECEVLTKRGDESRDVFAEPLPGDNWKALAKPLYEAVRNGVAHKFDLQYLFNEGGDAIMRVVLCFLAAFLPAPIAGGQGRGKGQQQQNNRSYEHEADTRTGTPPCGSKNSNCSGSSQYGKDQTRYHDQVSNFHSAGTGVGALEGVSFDEGLVVESKAGQILTEIGPQFPEIVNQSAFMANGYLKGEWPVVVDYEPDPGSYVVLTVTIPSALPFIRILPTNPAGRKLLIFNLPKEFGEGIKIGNFSIETTLSKRDRQATYFRLYGFGCGRRAVGSVAIDQLQFGPKSITAAQPETQFRFHSHSNFDKVQAEFIQVALVNNCVLGKKVDDKGMRNRILSDERVQDGWNAVKAQPGQIQFRVRGWMSGSNGGDWVSAFSPDLVLKK